MNYLAHAYLSGGYTDILIGNMISDFVKGKKKYDYSAEIQSGIMLHRMIDQFTDEHPVTKSAQEYFRPAYRLYAGAFIDVVYDHFLAIDKTIFPDDSDLLKFTIDVYNRLESSIALLPEAFQKIFPFMKTHNWLYNYQYIWGIEKSFEGLKYRASHIKEIETAFEIFNANYVVLQELYESFFPELKKFTQNRLY